MSYQSEVQLEKNMYDQLIRKGYEPVVLSDYKALVANFSAKIVEKGDLLYALYGATSGEVSISKIEGAINQATDLQGGQGNLSAHIVKSLKIELPSIEEQMKVSALLNRITDKIHLEQAKVDKLICQKQAFMQKMFI